MRFTPESQVCCFRKRTRIELDECEFRQIKSINHQNTLLCIVKLIAEWNEAFPVVNVVSLGRSNQSSIMNNHT